MTQIYSNLFSVGDYGDISLQALVDFHKRRLDIFFPSKELLFFIRLMSQTFPNFPYDMYTHSPLIQTGSHTEILISSYLKLSLRMWRLKPFINY